MNRKDTLAGLGGLLGSSIITPGVQQALSDPTTRELAEVQVARIIESPAVQKALEPTLRKAAFLGFVGVIAGATIANIITRTILK